MNQRIIMSSGIKKTFLILLFILLIYIGWLVMGPIRNIYAASQRISHIISGIQEEINLNDYDSANIYIKQAQDSVAVIQDNIKFVKFLKIIPPLKKKFIQTENTLKNVQTVCTDAIKIIDSLGQYENVDKNTLIAYFGQNPGDLISLENNFTNLVGNLKLLSNIFFKEKDSIFLNNINSLSQILKLAQPLNEYLFDIAGYNGSRRYLLLFQNNNELRPAGGFIGTYGILEVENGQVKEFFIDDIYHLDSQVIGKLNNEIPAPLKKYLKVEEWYMRDCNWDPDFSFSAIDCLNLYKIESNDKKEINGVIGMTPNAVNKIFDIIGAQKVEGVIFESDNFTNDLQKAVELYYQERDATHWERKNIINSLANVIIDSFSDLGAVEYKKLAELINENLETRDIILYSKNENIQKKISQADWSGEVIQSDQDYLMVVDSNLASYKSDQFIKRNFHYNLEEMEDNSLRAIVELHYQHQGSFSWNSTRYRTYTRLIVPLGSELIKVTGAMDNDRSAQEGQIDTYNKYNKTIFGTFIAIEPGQEKSLIFEYKLPANIQKQISEKDYSIYLQKQAGIEKINYLININFKENLNNYQVNLEDVIQNNLAGFSARLDLRKDFLLNFNWE